MRLSGPLAARLVELRARTQLAIKDIARALAQRGAIERRSAAPQQRPVGVPIEYSPHRGRVLSVR